MKELWNFVLLADLVETDVRFLNASSTPWMEVAVLIMVGLMVMFAAFAIFFIHRQQKRDAGDGQMRKEGERKENEYGEHV